jgi:hypothetical protein
LRGELAAHVFEDAEGVHEALQWKCDYEFGDWAQFTVSPARHGFQPMKFEPYDTVDDRYLFEPIAKICGHVIHPLL